MTSYSLTHVPGDRPDPFRLDVMPILPSFTDDAIRKYYFNEVRENLLRLKPQYRQSFNIECNKLNSVVMERTTLLNMILERHPEYKAER